MYLVRKYPYPNRGTLFPDHCRKSEKRMSLLSHFAGKWESKDRSLAVRRAGSGTRFGEEKGAFYNAIRPFIGKGYGEKTHGWYATKIIQLCGKIKKYGFGQFL